MSRYDWESGTLKIPSKAWKPLRDGLALAYNKRQAELLAAALELHKLMGEWKKTAPRGKFTVRTAWGALRDGGRHRALFERIGEDDDYLVMRSLMGKSEKGERIETKLATPKKQDFPLAVSTKTTHYSASSDAGISVDHENKELTWSVSENNRAVERARESRMGRVMFALLAKVEWTRGSGGEFAGNDEYNRDDRESGGASNYTTQRFGPKTKADKEFAAIQRRALAPAYGGLRRW